MTKIILAHELLEVGVSKSQIAQDLGVSRRTIIRWSQALEKHGSLHAYLESYHQAKKGARQKRKADAILKRRIWALREAHHLLVAQAARQVIQMDTVFFGEVFAFTAVDVFTKESDVLLRPALEAADGKVFLEYCMPRQFDGFSEIIQTDGGREFQGEFNQTVVAYCTRHRIARPYKKNEQAFIESFNRSLRKECLGWAKYRVSEIPQLALQVEDWLRYYHFERPHLSLNMRPPLTVQV